VRQQGRSPYEKNGARRPDYSIASATMVQKLFIGGIPWKTSKEELQDAFSKAGEVVSASIVMDRETRESRGFGFVEMADEAAAESAISMWNGKDFGGRMLKVDYARPKEATDNEQGGGYRRAE
jgi:RNA recognition motif-containing protein